MDAELQRNLQILMGQSTPNKTPELTAGEKQKLADAYDELFFGLAGANWANGDKTLGAAWYAALQQIGGMMGAKDKNNPAAMHLNQIFAAHRIKWSQRLMTSQSKDKKMAMVQEIKQKWKTDRAKQIGNAMAVINAIIQKYQAHVAAQQQVAPTKVDPNKAMMFMAAKQNLNGR